MLSAFYALRLSADASQRATLADREQIVWRVLVLLMMLLGLVVLGSLDIHVTEAPS